MTEKAYILYQVKKMAKQLDRTPLQDEFTKIVSRHYIEKWFGTYNKLLAEAGIEINKDNVGRKKKQ